MNQSLPIYDTTFLVDDAIRKRHPEWKGRWIYPRWCDHVDSLSRVWRTPGGATKTINSSLTQRRAATFTVEAGCLIIHLPMAGHKDVAMRFVDYMALVERGCDGRFYVSTMDTRESVTVNLAGRGACLHTKAVVARLIADAAKHHTVSFQDRDPLNLRRENLVRRGEAPAHPRRGSRKKWETFDARAHVARAHVHPSRRRKT